MNVIGDFGKFIIRYQNQIELFLILLVVVLAVIFVIRLILGERRKRALLSQINDTVSDIHTAVSHIDNQKSDVIYIDNRTGGSASSAELCREAASAVESAVENAAADGAERAEEPPESSAGREQVPDGLTADETSVECADMTDEGGAAPPDENPATLSEGLSEGLSEELSEEEPAETPRKYTSLDCGISKNGKIYTIEELERQIKE